MSDAYVDRKVMEYLKAAKMDMPGYLTPGEIGWIKRGCFWLHLLSETVTPSVILSGRNR